MAERAIAARKSQLFLHSVIPVTKSRDEVVQQKLKRGKFPWTITGCLHLLGAIILLAALVISVAKEECSGASPWRKYLFPITTGIFLLWTITIYLIFSFGLTIKKAGLWVTVDIVSLLALSLLEIISSVLTMLDCAGVEEMKNIPESIGIAGSVATIFSCAALIIMYRYKEYEDEFMVVPGPRQNQPNQNQSKNGIENTNFRDFADSRKSIAA